VIDTDIVMPNINPEPTASHIVTAHCTVWHYIAQGLQGLL